MSASLETLVVAAYIFADELSNPRRGPQGKITDAELVALGGGASGDGSPLRSPVPRPGERLLPGWFPHLPDQSQYNRRLRRLAPTIATVQLRVAELIANTSR